ncbi:MAG: hypothetical protein ACYDD4_10635 [Acidimicrobiales bacterium]
MSCPTATFCIGVTNDGGAVVWNGSSFSAAQPIDGNGNLAAVSCVTANFCLALDSGYNWLTWNGTSWNTPQPMGTVRTSPTPSFVNWMSCATTSFCVAVLSDSEAVVWNGTTWSSPQLTDQGLDGAVGPAATSSNGHPAIGMQSVSCASATFCVAVGTDGDAVVGR